MATKKADKKYPYYDFHLSGLKETCNFVSKFMVKDSKFIETKWGGYFEKGKRKIGITISPWQSKDVEKSLKINKWKNGYGINLHPFFARYSRGIRNSVKKGLGIKD